MNGKIFAAGFVAFAVIFGAGLYYAMVYAYYEKVEGITEITVQGQTIAVSNYEGIDATSSGLKLRGCFTVNPADFEMLKLIRGFQIVFYYFKGQNEISRTSCVKIFDLQKVGLKNGRKLVK